MYGGISSFAIGGGYDLLINHDCNLIKNSYSDLGWSYELPN